MPSGKKARGRKNRAKKEATRTANLRSLWEPTVFRESSVDKAASSCEHLAAALPRIPSQGPVVSFMNHIASEGFFDRAKCFVGVDVIPIQLFFQPLSRFPEVAGKESERSLAINLLLRFIRNTFLSYSVVEGENWYHNSSPNEVVICCMINALEVLGTYSDWEVVKRRAGKMTNKLWGGNRRDIVKFVAKRLPCTCLKELHRAARKKLAKKGTCFACFKRFPRSQLYVCTGCNHNVYCSSACQIADWSCHKQDCGHPELVSRDLPGDYVVSP